MALCTVKAPLPPGTPVSGGHSRPILIVKYLGQVEAYAAYREGRYEFHLPTRLCEALEAGELEARFQVDDGIPIGILLVGE